MMVVKKNRHLFRQPAADLGLTLHWGRDRLTVTNPETGSSMWWHYTNFSSPRVLAEVVREALLSHPLWLRDASRSAEAFHSAGPSGVGLQNRIIDRLNSEERKAPSRRAPRR